MRRDFDKQALIKARVSSNKVISKKRERKIVDGISVVRAADIRFLEVS